MLNNSIHYRAGNLFADEISIEEIAEQVGTPVYIYSLKRMLHNLERIRSAFSVLKPEIHYSAKANANLAVLKTLVQAGAGIDAVSAGEIHKALLAGADTAHIVFAGVGKTRDELRYALEKQIGWINVENVGELESIQELAVLTDRKQVRVALRLNPDIAAPTHRHIATGHGAAKFGLSIQTVRELLRRQDDFPNVSIEGLHIHIGSQLHDTNATRQAVETVLEILHPYPTIRTINIGGGLAVAYSAEEPIPSWDDFGAAVTPLLKDYQVILEPGRSVIADAGLFVISVLYTKEQGGEHLLITDGSMAELIRPALYEAHHMIVPVADYKRDKKLYHVVGPVCESADALGHNIEIQATVTNEKLAVLTAGAYGMVMSSNYNQRLRPPEVVISPDGQSWQVARQRETWADLVSHEQ